jgi:3-oxoacyl-[acyl-carrier protein] reductase
MKRTVIITGGTKGLGREISLAFARNGCFVVALYAADMLAAREWDALLAEAGLAGISLKHDVAEAAPALRDLPEIQLADQLVLVHNACAAFAPAPMHLLTWQDFENHHRVAVKGAWECSQPLLRLMLRKKAGTIITVLTSALEGAAPKGFAAYLTAKHALRGFTLALAAEYAPRGLKIFSVSPGYMETPLTGQWDHRMRDAIREHAGRISIPPAAARQLVELAESDNVPGQGENYCI